MSISAIKQAVSLPMIAAEYGEVRKSGAQWLMLCPWHSEQRPSLRVYEDHAFCFTCQAHGDVIDFVAQMEGISKGRALKLLSDRTGIPLDGKPRTRIQKVYDSQEREFAGWWLARLLRRLERELTAYCIRGAEDHCESRGEVLRQVRAIKGIELRALVARAATEQDRREWQADKKDAEWWTGWCVEAITHGASINA